MKIVNIIVSIWGLWVISSIIYICKKGLHLQNLFDKRLDEGLQEEKPLFWITMLPKREMKYIMEKYRGDKELIRSYLELRRAKQRIMTITFFVIAALAIIDIIFS